MTTRGWGVLGSRSRDWAVRWVWGGMGLEATLRVITIQYGGCGCCLELLPLRRRVDLVSGVAVVREVRCLYGGRAIARWGEA